MTLLLFKLFSAPALILAVTLVGRRYGQAVAGWLVALPLTSGPVAVLLAIEHGPRFAQQAAEGSLTGTIAQPCYAATYAWLARRGHGWTVGTLAASVVFFAAGALSLRLDLGVLGTTLAGIAAIIAALIVIGRPAPPERPTATPRWDLPLRMTIAGALVAGLTSIAQAIGPDRVGLIATFPAFIVVLSAFAHGFEGADAARGLMRGLMMGLYGFGAFFVAFAALVARAGTAVAFCAAVILSLTVHGIALTLMRR